VGLTSLRNKNSGTCGKVRFSFSAVSSPAGRSLAISKTTRSGRTSVALASISAPFFAAP
jgi:hypothetical protein